MTDFSDIRPYNDQEVRPVLDRLLQDTELLVLLAKLRLGSWVEGVPKFLLCPLVRHFLAREVKQVCDVSSFQMVVERYMDRMIESTTTEFTVSGLDKLGAHQPYLFMSNHRDITLDPAFTNYALYHNDHDTARIAIGDNLLTKPFASDLMRLNKSFIVNRSVTAPRQILAATRQLSAYIRHSIVEEKSPIWIAHREGRAKDGFDKTEPAIIKMLSMGRDKKAPLEEHLQSLNIVPIAISYEWDPCDAAKAGELYARTEQGGYEKDEHEDIASIGLGISGQKGRVHVAFGEPLTMNLGDPITVAEQMDRQIINNYHLHPSNYFAYHRLHDQWPDHSAMGEDQPFDPNRFKAEEQAFNQRIEAMPEEHRRYALGIYANAIVSKLKLLAVNEP